MKKIHNIPVSRDGAVDYISGKIRFNGFTDYAGLLPVNDEILKPYAPVGFPYPENKLTGGVLSCQSH